MTPGEPEKRSNGGGLGVDRYGGGVVDPSVNVQALNDASSRRQDDLRVETNRRLDSEIVEDKNVPQVTKAAATMDRVFTAVQVGRGAIPAPALPAAEVKKAPPNPAA